MGEGRDGVALGEGLDGCVTCNSRSFVSLGMTSQFLGPTKTIPLGEGVGDEAG